MLIGRPYVYGLAANGAEGVAQVVNILREELEMAMALTSQPNITSVDTIRPVEMTWRRDMEVLHNLDFA